MQAPSLLRRLLPRTAPVPTRDIDGIAVSQLDMESTLELMRTWLGEERPRRVATANVDFLRLASEREDLRRCLLTADLVTPDGTPLVWLSRLLGGSVHERVAGSDLVPRLVGLAARDGRPVYFLGGQDGVGELAAIKLAELYPDLRIAGVAEPFCDWDDPGQAGAVADEIRASGADLLLVALGCPKQELFLERYLERSGARVGVGIGATLDFVAGRLRRASPALGRMGLEWAWRLALEPQRLAGRYARDLRYLSRLGARLLRRPRTGVPA